MESEGKTVAIVHRVLIACVMTVVVVATDARADTAEAQNTGVAVPMPLAATEDEGGVREQFAGTFVAPTYEAPPQRTFDVPGGSAETVRRAQPDRAWNDTVVFAAGGAGVISLIMIGLILRACVRADARGKKSLVWTVEGKIATTIGVVVMAMCGAGVMCARASVQTQEAARRANVAVNEGGTLATICGKLEAMRANAESFAAGGNEKDLEQYALARGQVRNGLALADGLDSVASSVGAFHESFTKLVELSDRDAAMIESQIVPAHERAEEILGHVSLSIADGNAGSAGGHLDLAMTFTGSMRSIFERGMRDGRDLDAVVFAARRATQAIQEASEGIPDQSRGRALAEATQALEFVADRLGELSVARGERETAAREMEKRGLVMVSKEHVIREFLSTWEARAMAEADGLASRERMLALGAAGTCAVVAALMGYLLMRGMGRRMRRVLETLRGLAANDLMQAPVNSTSLDEIGELSRAADKVAAGMRDVITEMSISLSDVENAASRVAMDARVGGGTGSGALNSGTHGTEGTNRAAEQLTTRAEQLRAMVGRYKIDYKSIAGADGSSGVGDERRVA